MDQTKKNNADVEMVNGLTLEQYIRKYEREAIVEDYVSAGGERSETNKMTKRDMFLELADMETKTNKTKSKTYIVESPTEDPPESGIQIEEPDQGSGKKESDKSNKSNANKKPKKKTAGNKKMTKKNKPKQIQTKAKNTKELSDENILNLFGEEDPLKIVLERGMIFKMNTHCWWGKSSKVPEDMLNNAPKKILRGIQSLIDEKYLGPLNSYRQRGDRVIIKNGFSYLGMRGMYFVPKNLIDKTLKELARCRDEFQEELTDFLKNFKRYKTEWYEFCVQNEINVPKEEWYPNMANLKSKFKFEWSSFALELPDKELGLLTEEQYKEAQDQHRKQATEFLSYQLTTIALKFEEVITKLSERLAAGESVKPKSLSSLKSFMETFNDINVTNNEDLSKLVTRMSLVLGSKSAKDINENDAIRDRLKGKVTMLAEKVTNLIDTDSKFRRSLDF